MGSSYGEELSQTNLELVNASKWTSGRMKVLSNMKENEKKF